ncbi:MAG TPA: proton-conducting transporter membrane subunit [Acidimicrobiales bacterium]|nr:proton-conducting transporter membrane subunit [Acidimicrobiales bacterium]
MAAVLIALIAFPFFVAVATFFLPAAASRVLTVVSGAAAFGLSLAVIPTAATHSQVAVGSLLRVDALSVVFLVATTFLYGATAVFAGGYLHLADSAAGTRYGRRFYAGLNLFCWSMVAAPLVNGLALLWVAIEITTVISALLVAIDDTDGATEASWKYVLIASLGLGIALLATIIMYYAGTTVFGSAYDLSYTKLLAGAGHFPPDVVRLAFVLAVLGFGTKMGLVPVHTWLPDAHSEAPTPVSALLSGALLAISFYAILRYFQIAVRTLGPTFPRNVLLIFGLASLLLAALYLLSQRDLKRLLAYSSVEHMGILAIGMSFGAPIAVVGVLLHVLAHAAAKGTAFFGAGSVVRKFATKDMTKIRGGIGALPWSGPMLVAAVLALSAMPPFGIFRSEFLIVSGGLSDPRDTVAAVLVVLVTLAFFGLSWFTTQTMLTPEVAAATPGAAGPVVTPPKGEVSRWIVVAMVLGLVALLILGVHPPAQLSHLLDRAAGELGSPR